jgi:muconolactone delta-isomerase
MKFLVLWRIGAARMTQDVVRSVLEQPKYAQKLEADGKLECRYHLIGQHGGAWIYKVSSNEELDRLLAMSPVYNFATYDVLALAEMNDAATVAGR